MPAQTANNSVKRPRGRPVKEVKGEMLWIPSEYVQAVKAYLEIAKQKQMQTER